VAEASACALPTVAFRTGGLPDMIQHKESGYLAKAFDVEDFSRGIVYIANDNKNMSKKARIMAEGLYDPIAHAKSLIENYKKIKK